MSNTKLENQNLHYNERRKIGYIKINSTEGQLTFTVFEKTGAIIYNRPNVHRDNAKQKNVIHLNVKPDLFIDHALQIKQHMQMLIKVFFNLDVEDFELIIHKFK